MCVESWDQDGFNAPVFNGWIPCELASEPQTFLLTVFVSFVTRSFLPFLAALQKNWPAALHVNRFFPFLKWHGCCIMFKSLSTKWHHQCPCDIINDVMKSHLMEKWHEIALSALLRASRCPPALHLPPSLDIGTCVIMWHHRWQWKWPTMTLFLEGIWGLHKHNFKAELWAVTTLQEQLTFWSNLDQWNGNQVAISHHDHPVDASKWQTQSICMKMPCLQMKWFG